MQYPAKATPKAVAKAARLVATAAKATAAVPKAVALAAAAAVPKPAGGSRPRIANAVPKAARGSRPIRAKLKINNSNLLMPFHDITDDPYFIRV